MWTALFIFIVFLYFILTRLFIIVEMREEVIQERLGKYKKTLKPGFHFLIPFVDRAAYHQEMREQVIDVPSQTCITKDNIEVTVDGIAYLKVMDSHKASYGISNYKAAAINLAQTTMRSEIGKISLDDTFSEREKMNENIVQEIDKAADPWGVKVLRYEIRNIRPSNEIVDTMEKQMEAERQKRADITSSEGMREARINEAQGRAKEIELVATATANGIRRVAQAIDKPGGSLAVQTKLVEQYIDQFGKIIKSTNVSVLPVETANLKTFFEGVATVSDHTTGGRAVKTSTSKGAK